MELMRSGKEIFREFLSSRFETDWKSTVQRKPRRSPRFEAFAAETPETSGPGMLMSDGLAPIVNNTVSVRPSGIGE